MWLFKTFLASIVEPKKYKTLIELRNRKILGYFIFWMAIFGFGLGLYTQFSEIPKFKAELEKTKQFLIESYPEDLVINWDKEKLTTSPEKYSDIEFESSLDGQEDNLAFEYKNKELDVNSFPITTDLKIIVDQTQIYFPNPESWSAIEFKNFSYFKNEFKINHDNIEKTSELAQKEVLESIDKNTPFVYLFLILFIIVTRVSVSLFYGTLVFLVGKILKFPKNWKQSWNLSMLIIVLAEMVSQIANLSYQTLNIPMFSLSFWLIIWYVFFVNIKKPSTRGA